MIIIGGTIQFSTDDREALFEKIRQMMADSQAEDGCLAYEFSPDISKPDILHLYEVWESAEALDAHGQSSHMAAFREKVIPIFGSRDITRYEAKVAG